MYVIGCANTSLHLWKFATWRSNVYGFIVCVCMCVYTYIYTYIYHILFFHSYVWWTLRLFPCQWLLETMLQYMWRCRYLFDMIISFYSDVYALKWNCWIGFSYFLSFFLLWILPRYNWGHTHRVNNKNWGVNAKDSRKIINLIKFQW